MDFSKSKLTFVLACRWISPKAQGGVAMHNGYLIQALEKSLSVKIFSLSSDENQIYYQRRGIAYHPVVAALPGWLNQLTLTQALKNGLRAWQDWKISLAMAKALEADPPNIVEFMDIHSEGYVFLRRNPKGIRRTRVVIRSHTPWGILKLTYLPEEIRGVDGWWAIERERYCLHACDAITTPSENLKKQLIKVYDLPPEKITVLPNLLDTDHFRPMEATVNSVFTFLHVGRFERAKGVITMIKAFIEVAKTCGKPIRLINVGQARGNAYNECMTLLNDAGLQEQVTFAGFIPYDDLPRYYNQADAVIVPAEIYESFSYTVAQAMACGKVIIHSDSGGMPETSNMGQFGILFKRCHPHQLIRAMETVIDNPGYINHHAVDYSISKFGIKHNAEIFFNYYHNL